MTRVTSSLDPRELFYERIAERFDGVMDRYDLARRIWLSFEVLLGGERLDGVAALDVGCGTGPFALEAVHRGASVVGLDVGPRLLDIARRKGLVRAVAADALALPFPAAAFDLVISSECIEHTRGPASAVGEMLRVLRPGGRLVITCPNAAWRWALGIAQGLRLRPYHGIEIWPGWRDLERWIAAAGGSVVRHRGVHALPFQLPLAARFLPTVDRAGRALERVFVNQGALAVKTG